MSFLALFLSFAMANNRVGNGGDAIVCRDHGKIKSVEVLDLFESNSDLGLITLTDEWKITEDLFQQLKRLSPKFSEMYLRRLTTIRDDIEWRKKGALADIQDSFELVRALDPECITEQAAIKRRNSDLRSKTFVFDKNIWDAMTPIQRSALLIHEITYEHFSKLGKENSTEARKFTAFMFSDDLSLMSVSKYRKWMLELKIPQY